MTDLRDAARQALNSLRGYRREISCEQPCDAEQALVAALEQPEHGVTLKPVFYAPRRLSNEEVMAVIGPFRETEQEPVAKSTWQKLYETAIDQRNEAVAEVKRLLEQPNQAQAMRDAGYTRRPTLREMAALEQQEQEPAWNSVGATSLEFETECSDGTRFLNVAQMPAHAVRWRVVTPPRREWRGLDRDETMHLMNDTAENYWADEAHIQRFSRALEAKMKERNEL